MSHTSRSPYYRQSLGPIDELYLLFKKGNLKDYLSHKWTARIKRQTELAALRATGQCKYLELGKSRRFIVLPTLPIKMISYIFEKFEFSHTLNI